MSNIKTIELNQELPDPTKRLKYTTGLVLGEDDFKQEQFYLMERDRLHQHALHGYGTICGLKVSVGEREGDPTVLVSPGTAVNPKGETIRVTKKQCASLNKWILDNRDVILDKIPDLTLVSPDVYELPVYVVLCYYECTTDEVPIPSPPCRSQDETSAPSRIKDHFKLSLELEGPARVEEEAVRCFGRFLEMIEITHNAGEYQDRESMENMVRNLFTSPGSDDKLYLRPDEAHEILEAVFRVWVTELRPGLLEEGKVCSDIPTESCVLLAQLDMEVRTVGEQLLLQGGAEDIVVIEDDRPVLLHTSLLQEWLLCGGFGSDSNHTHVLKDMDDVDAPSPGEDQVLTWKSDHWEAADPAAAEISEHDHALDDMTDVELSSPGPLDGQILIRQSGKWIVETPGFEKGLTRIAAINWSHGGESNLAVTLEGTPKKALVVAFGKENVSDEGKVKVSSLDENTFQVFMEIEYSAYGYLRRIRPEGFNILPVNPGGSDGNDLSSLTPIDAGEEDTRAAAFVLSDTIYNYLSSGRKITIVIKGDFILDETGGKAIDARFVRGQLPTGNLITGSDYGIQGGNFESWVRIRIVPLVKDLNTVTKEDLIQIEGIGKKLADRIIEHRESHKGFKSIDELAEVTGVTPARVKQLKKYLEVKK